MINYFTLQELCVTNTGLSNIPTWEAVENLKILKDELLNPLRFKWGHPIIISSGYRSILVNKKVGGVNNSQHLTGEAVDIDLGSKEKNKELFHFIKNNFEFDQLINEKDFEWVHVSYKRNKNRKEVLDIN